MKSSAMTQPALAVLLLIAAAGCATLPDKTPAPPESSQSPNLKCPKTSEKITLDGKLDEPDWSRVAELPFMLSRNNRQEKAVTEGGYGKILWDDQFLYIAAVLEDSDVVSYTKARDQHTYQQGDALEIFLKFAADNRYIELHVTPGNFNTDFFFPSRGSAIFPESYIGGDSATEWDCAMRSNVTVDGTLNNWRDRDRGWAVELAIPLADLNEVFDERIESGTRLLFSLCRYNYGRYLDAKELSSTSDLAVTNFHRYEDFGTIEFARE